MATLNLNDLDFILQQIEIAEAHAAGGSLVDLVGNPLLPYGLRTVDGTLNNIIPGRETWGAADQEFIRLLEADYRIGQADPDFDIDGPGPAAPGTSADYSYTTTPGNVVDTAPRTISNLIADQTLNNPAAILAALKFAGIEGVAATAALAEIQEAFANASDPAAATALAQANVDAAAAQLATAQAARGLAATIDPLYQVAATAYAAAIPQMAVAEAGYANALAMLQALQSQLGVTGTVITAVHTAAMGAILTEVSHARIAASAARTALNPPGTDVVVADDLADAAALVTLGNQLFNSVTALSNNNPEGTTTVAGDVTRFQTALTRAQDASTNSTALGNQLDVSNAVAIVNANALTLATQAVTAAETALAEAEAVLADPTAAAQEALDAVLAEFGLETTANGSLIIPNVAPDEGISAPFNSWMTLFGQFFDHGLDLVEKTATTKVYVPLLPDDPLYVEGGHANFMVITRTVEDARNVTTPFVDQNQTYTSHASHQVFLREYERVDQDGNAATNDVFATGHLLEGSNGGLANWADVKAHSASMLGLRLSDEHIGKVPLLATDEYGQFDRGPNGFAQIMVTVSDGTNSRVVAVEGKAIDEDDASAGLDIRSIDLGDLRAAQITELASGIDPLNGNTASYTFSVEFTGHAFLDDIAHAANPYNSNGGNRSADPNGTAGDHFSQPVDAAGNPLAVSPLDLGNNQVGSGSAFYDNEVLDEHFITGDGRGNENIGLTAVHHVFHSEHNRQVEEIKHTLAAGGVEALNPWLLVDLAPNAVIPPAGPAREAFLDGLDWDGERLFQAARFATEMQYQHLVFEEFARKVNPLIDLFVFNPTMDVNPAIFAEFAHVVYRFGHSMLTETVDRLGADGQTRDDLGLIEAFLNPVAFDDGYASADEAAGAIIRGMTRQVGNEIDEFVTEALRNNLLGLPLDLATVNLARGRETGMPTLNDARTQLYAATNSDWLKPYQSWTELAENLKNPASVINFIAAYGNHAALLAAETLDDKRKAAMALVFGDDDGTPDTVTINGQEISITDRAQFLAGTGGYADRGGLDNIDLWIGGLAEAILPFGGMLGSTFTAVFEMQLENLQNGDRFYYLSRTQGLHFLTELESNSFAEIIKLNTDLGSSQTALPGEVFANAEYILQVDQSLQTDYDPASAGKDPVSDDPVLGALSPKVLRGTVVSEIDGRTYTQLKFVGGEHVVLGGDNSANLLIGDLGDDAIWGEGGDDLIIGGHGINRLHGGDGSDIIFGGGDAEFIHGEAGNDIIQGGNGIGDLIFGDGGSDFVIAGIDGKEVFGGEGNDFIIGTADVDFLLGGEGDDWLEGGEGFDTTAGDNSQLFFNSDIIGHDVMFAGSNEHDFDAESGDDIMVQGESVMRNEGMLGFDWVSFEEHTSFGADADMRVKIFTNVENDILRNRFDRVEAMSGSSLDDVLIGDDRVAPAGPFNPGVPVNEQSLEGDQLDRAGAERVIGLHEVLGFASVAAMRAAFPNATDVVFDSGNILLGGSGDDRLQGNGGNDILDGDRSLNVRIAITDGAGNIIGSAEKMQGLVTMNDTGSPLHGRQLDALVFARAVDPGNLQIVREILNQPETGGIDIAVFRGLQAEYDVTENPDGSFTVVHARAPVPGAIGDDGTDTLRNIEILQFADGVQIIGDVPNTDATGQLAIVNSGGGDPAVGQTFTAAIGTVADADGLPPFPAGFSFTWQVEETPGAGDWVAVEDPFTELPITGPSFVATPAMALEGLAVRVLATFTGGNGVPETVLSPATIALAAASVTPATDGDDAIFGTVGADVIDALAGDDDIQAFAGNDTIVGGAGSDVIDGGNGIDTAVFDALLSDITFVRTPTGTIEVVDAAAGTEDEVISIEQFQFNIGGATATLSLAQVEALADPAPAENLAATNGNDLLVDTVGTARNLNALGGADIVLGLNQADTLSGGDGDDLIDGGAGADVLNGDAGNDILLGGAGADTLSGGADNDVLVGGAGADVLNGGGGADILEGGAGNDTLNGDAASDVLVGGAGADVANGGAGDDRFIAVVGDGNDTYNGNGGIDTLDLSGTTAAATVSTTLASSAQIGNDLIQGIENVIGGQGNDTITLNGEANLIDGQAGNDVINAGGGNDTVVGGAGNDTMNGGAGNDVFLFASGFGNDTINNFDANPNGGGQDLLDLTGLGIDAGDFAARVLIESTSAGVLVTIDGADTILLAGLNGTGNNAVTQQDFIINI